MLPKLREFRRPVRIIFGDADPYLNKGVARRFHELFPVSELFLLSGARHFVQMDEPAQVARLIMAMPRQVVSRVTLLGCRQIDLVPWVRHFITEVLRVP
jgi:pimeloyl-ACP methyl ester carboxylesterase